MQKLLMILTLLLSSASALAQNGNRYFGEVDVEPYTHAGYSGYLGFTPTDRPRREIGIGAWSYRQPADFIEWMNEKNAGFNVRQSAQVLVFKRYYNVGVINAAQGLETQGLFTGCMLGHMSYEYSRSDSPGTKATSHNLLIMPEVGYKAFLLNDTFYFSGSVGGGWTPHLSGNGKIGTHSYQESRVMPFFSLMVGAEI